jgi:hypothetical protein
MRRSPADQSVVAVKLLLAGVGVEPRVWLIRTVESINQGLPGRKRGNMPKLGVVKPYDIPKQECGRRTGRWRRTRVRREWTR